MKAVIQSGYGAQETLSISELPPPGIERHQVLIRVAAAGVDRGAYHLMRGVPYVVRLMGYGVRSPKVSVPGTNVAGRVEAVGEYVARFRPGDEVYGTCRGAFAEFAVADAECLALRPAVVSPEEAATLPYSGGTALQAVRDHGGVTAVNRPGFDGGSVYWIPTPVGSVCWAA